MFCRIAYHEGVVRDILCDHGHGADEGIFPDSVAADDGAVGPQGGAHNRNVRSEG